MTVLGSHDIELDHLVADALYGADDGKGNSRRPIPEETWMKGTRDEQREPVASASRRELDGQLLTAGDRLRLHQLMTLEQLEKAIAAPEQERTEQSSQLASMPARWELTRGIELYHWQKECIEQWLKKGKGIIKVVTGLGKTILALAIAERLQREVDPELRVVIVVPTIVLMNQWYTEIVERSNLPREFVGRLGGGHQDDLSTRRVLICVLPSASQKLPGMVRKANIKEHLLLVVDECHRAGATEAKKVLNTPRRWSLGLSATPEREDEEEEADGFENTVLGRKLGTVVYEMTLAQALELGLLPPFVIKHYALPLTAAERLRYEQLSRQIADAEAELRSLAPHGKTSGAGFFRWLRGGAMRSEAGPLAGRYLALLDKRLNLLFGMEARRKAVLKILEKELTDDPQRRAILFHESIDEVNKLFVEMQARGLPVVAEHSKLPDGLREGGIWLFRKGIAKVIVSAKALIEGFNVPEADLGVIVASSKSVRQRIQSLGRLLRKYRDPHGQEKASVIHVLYAKDTVDETIYEKVDWEEITGLEANEFYEWDVESEPLKVDGPPRRPLPSDTAVDATSLASGDEYPGRYEGDEFSCDTAGNVYDSSGKPVVVPEGLVQKIREIKGSFGRFRVTPRQRHVLVRVPAPQGDSATVYVTTLSEPLRRPERRRQMPPPQQWAAEAKPGDEYPYEGVEVREELAFGRKRGGVIKKRVRGGELYARTSRDAQNQESGKEADRLLEIWRNLHREDPDVVITKFQINAHGHAVYRAKGRLRFLAALRAPLEFPESHTG